MNSPTEPVSEPRHSRVETATQPVVIACLMAFTVIAVAIGVVLGATGWTLWMSIAFAAGYSISGSV